MEPRVSEKPTAPLATLGLAPPAPDQPVLIAGPTASGKSELALRVAEAHGGIIINADALQVFDGWRLVTARPSDADLTRAPHALYGHIPFDQPYSVGDWLREIAPILRGSDRPIIVGGSGLYLSALTEGLADIPATPTDIRLKADALSLATMIAELDAETAAGIDLNNRMRVQRAWEVQTATGRSLSDWQQATASPILKPDNALRLCLAAPPEWLTPRIDLRFRQMMRDGALDEAREMLPLWDPALPSSKAIGAAQMIAVLTGEMTEDGAIESSVIASRQYAKRQRTWFRKRMADWTWLDASGL